MSCAENAVALWKTKRGQLKNMIYTTSLHGCVWNWDIPYPPNGNFSVENDHESVDSRYTITRSYSDWTYLPSGYD